MIKKLMIVVVLSSCNHLGSNYKSVEYFVVKGDTLGKTELIKKDLYLTVDYQRFNGVKILKEKTEHRKNGMRHGNSFFYHSNGKLKSIVEYNEGRIWEVKEYNDSQGNALDFGRISKGEGYLREFYRDIDILKEEGEIIKGYKEGYWIRYCGDGKKYVILFYMLRGRAN